MAVNNVNINLDELPTSIQEQIDLENGKILDFISNVVVNLTPEEAEAVQVLAHRLVEDYDYPKDNIQTHPQFHVRKRPSDERKEYPIDIAVFKNNKKNEENLFLIAECKQPDKNVGLRQLKIYLDMSPAIVGVWYNGKDHIYIRKIQKIDGTLDYIEIPNIPKYGQRIEDIGKYKRKDLKPTANLKALFRDIRNHLSQQAVGITRDEKLAQEIINILFCKIYDEKITGPDEIVSFRSGFDESPSSVSQRLKTLFDKVKREYADIFDPEESITLDDVSINYVVGELQNYCITEAERDVLGDAFEVFIGPALKGGQGQFFTPRNVVKLAVNFIDPDPGQLVIDPACGSGGFLIVVVEYIWNKIKIEAQKRGFSSDWIIDQQKKIAAKSVCGIDKDSFLAKVTKAYMAIIGDGRGGIFCENSLESTQNWQLKTQERISLNSFAILFTNPPFGAKIPVKEHAILSKYNLGYKYHKIEKGKSWEKTAKIQNQQPPQILFIERCLDLLAPGGKMAIVLPDGVLGGSKIGYIPHYIKKNAKILAMIDCPKETFQPFVSTKTHLVFLQKKTATEIEANPDYDVFMAIANYVGHDKKGNPIHILVNNKSVEKDDLPSIISNYNAYKKGTLKKADYNTLGYVISSNWLDNYIVANRYLPEFIDALEEIKSLENNGKFFLKNIDDIKAKLFTGANINAEEYLEDSPYRYLMTACITEYGINPSKFKFIGEKPYNQNSSKMIKTNDIVLNRSGQSGVATLFPEDMDGVMACGFSFVLRLKREYDPYYVAAFLNSRLGRLQMQRLAFGSILDHITKDDLENIIIPFPNDANLTSKISANFKKVIVNQMNARVEFNNFFKSYDRDIFF